MIKDILRNLAEKAGYDFIKNSNFDYGKKFIKKSSVPNLDYFETPIGNYYLPQKNKGDIVAQKMKEGNLFEPFIIDVAKKYIKKGTSVLDIGANYGQMSIEFSKLVSDTGSVYAFEAQEIVFNILSENLKANGSKNVKTFFNAVYDKQDIELFFPEPDFVRFSSYGSYGIDPNAKTGKKVKSITIDSIEFEQPVSFMKIDIQGSDLFALQGAVKTIEKYKMPVIFEYEEQFQHEFGTSFQDYVTFVNDIGYKFLQTVQHINYLIVPK